MVVLARRVERRQVVVDRAAGFGLTACVLLAVSKGMAGGPANGALISTTERNTSGRSSANQAATGEPKSWPIMAAMER